MNTTINNNNNKNDKLAFATGQRLSLLQPQQNVREYLSGRQFWEDRHAGRSGGEERPRPPWRAKKRAFFVRQLTAGGKIRRLAVVCAAGLGKSTNLVWLAKELADKGQVPFLFTLDHPDLPNTYTDFWKRTLPDRFRKPTANADLPNDRVLPTLRRLREAGRITLLFDSIDQAHKNGLQLLRAVLESGVWANCPVVVSARPHAVFDGWDELIVPNEGAWRFARVEPLARPERELLLGPDGPDSAERRRLGAARYRRLPPGGRGLAENPRNIEYIRKCGDKPDRPRPSREPCRLVDYTLADLRTASHMFAGAADHRVRYGMTNPKARLLGVRKDRPPPPHAQERQIAFALDLLGALAYTMYRSPAPGSKGREGPFRPNVSHIPVAGMEKFLGRVLTCLQGAGVRGREYDLRDLEDDLDALAELNDTIQFDLLDTRPTRQGDFRWYDRSLQEFFAAWWLSRYATPKDIERLREWRYDDTRDETGKSLYAPLWGFLVEMPRAVRKDPLWAAAVGVLFEPGATRCCEMMFRAWPAMRRSRAGRKVIATWRNEFQSLLADPGPRGDVARQIPAGFRRCPPAPGDDRKPFLMGSPETETERDDDEHQHEVVVSPFALHEFLVTNAQYELFDPTHAKERWGWSPGSEPHPAGDDADRHPAVNVTWYQACCFARWAGYRLPTEAEWEYACRAGTTTPFHFGSILRGDLANHNGEYPYGTENKGPYLRTTTPPNSYPPNLWHLQDMHGNVWEWCQDFYASEYYNIGRRTDPCGPVRASSRVLRGGSWSSFGRDCRSARRVRNDPAIRYDGCGFRLAAVPEAGAK